MEGMWNDLLVLMEQLSARRQLMVIVPFMSGWTVQWNGYVPATLNVRLSLFAFVISPVAQAPSSSVAVM